MKSNDEYSANHSEHSNHVRSSGSESLLTVTTDRESNQDTDRDTVLNTSLPIGWDDVPTVLLLDTETTLERRLTVERTHL